MFELNCIETLSCKTWSHLYPTQTKSKYSKSHQQQKDTGTFLYELHIHNYPFHYSCILSQKNNRVTIHRYTISEIHISPFALKYINKIRHTKLPYCQNSSNIQ